MKILHTADWHLDAPLRGFSGEVRENLKKKLLQIPGQIAELCQKENCDLVLLAGDIFDGAYTKESYDAAYRALEECRVPVFVSPGNHDFLGIQSPWEREIWPENVHIFTRQQMDAVELSELDCRVYGGGFISMDCPALLEGFQARRDGKCQIAVLHGDPVSAASPCNPVNRKQVEYSHLTYLALGHIHKAGSFRAGETLCAWPGCPMGRGFDETGEKGALIAEIVGKTVFTRFVPLHFPEFIELQLQVASDPLHVLEQALPSVGNDNFYRITLIGESTGLDIPGLQKALERFPNLQLRDDTHPPVDVWKNAGQDTFEGVYFDLLQQALEQASPEEQGTVQLAAELSRRILEGQEVELP